MDRKEIRKLFSKLGIENSRILDISFPARSVIGVLVHQEFKQELIDTIIGSKGQITKDFNPLAHEHIVDPQYNNLAVANRTRLAKAVVFTASSDLNYIRKLVFLDIRLCLTQ
jgi:hypothetical protein